MHRKPFTPPYKARRIARAKRLRLVRWMLSMQSGSTMLMVSTPHRTPASDENQGFGFSDLVQLRDDEVPVDALYRKRLGAR